MIKDNEKDILFTEDGDFYLNRSNKKIRHITKYKNELPISLIKKRIQSSGAEWRSNNVIVANLDNFKGLPRREEFIEEIKSAIRAALIEDDLINSMNVEINVLGLKENIIGIGILVNGKDPSVDDTVALKLMYDFRENKFTPLDVLGVFS